MAARKNARIEVRLTEDLKANVEKAAAYLGQSVSEFVLATVRERAAAVGEQQERTRLTNRDRDRFLAALDAARPNEVLRASLEKYERNLSEGGPLVEDRVAEQSP